jgi:hypothetical protein
MKKIQTIMEYEKINTEHTFRSDQLLPGVIRRPFRQTIRGRSRVRRYVAEPIRVLRIRTARGKIFIVVLRLFLFGRETGRAEDLSTQNRSVGQDKLASGLAGGHVNVVLGGEKKPIPLTMDTKPVNLHCQLIFRLF